MSPQVIQWNKAYYQRAVWALYSVQCKIRNAYYTKHFLATV